MMRVWVEERETERERAILATSKSRVFVFICRRCLRHSQTQCHCAHSLSTSVYICQNGCCNEIWNGSLMAVERISKNHLVYEYHEGYIYHNSIPFGSVFWCRLVSVASSQNYSKREKENDTERNRGRGKEKMRKIWTMNQTKPEACETSTIGKKSKETTVSMEMFYLFSIILFIHTDRQTRMCSGIQWTRAHRYCFCSLQFR